VIAWQQPLLCSDLTMNYDANVIDDEDDNDDGDVVLED